MARQQSRVQATGILHSQRPGRSVPSFEARVHFWFEAKFGEPYTPLSSTDAYDLHPRFLAQFHKSTRESYSEAIHLAGQALDIDPCYAPAAALGALTRGLQLTQGFARPDEALFAEFARRAVQYGKDDPDALWMTAMGIALAGDAQTGASLVDRALSLNSNLAHARMTRGWIHIWLNQPKPAVDAFQRAMRLSPFDPLGYFFAGGLAGAAVEEGRYEDAIASADRALQEEGW